MMNRLKYGSTPNLLLNPLLHFNTIISVMSGSPGLICQLGSRVTGIRLKFIFMRFALPATIINSQNHVGSPKVHIICCIQTKHTKIYNI